MASYYWLISCFFSSPLFINALSNTSTLTWQVNTPFGMLVMDLITYKCLFTRQLTRKKKIWSDGVATVSRQSGKMVVYECDDGDWEVFLKTNKKKCIDTKFLRAQELQNALDGEIVTCDSCLVELERQISANEMSTPSTCERQELGSHASASVDPEASSHTTQIGGKRMQSVRPAAMTRKRPSSFRPPRQAPSSLNLASDGCMLHTHATQALAQTQDLTQNAIKPTLGQLAPARPESFVELDDCFSTSPMHSGESFQRQPPLPIKKTSLVSRFNRVRSQLGAPSHAVCPDESSAATNLTPLRSGM